MANQEEISGAKSKVLLISFGEIEDWKKWLEEMKCSYDMLMDKNRQIFRSFGLHRSVYKVWNISCMKNLATKLTQGSELPKPYRNIHYDSSQMGGDFILNKDGRLIYKHLSSKPTDRPSVDSIIEVITKLNV